MENLTNHEEQTGDLKVPGIIGDIYSDRDRLEDLVCDVWRWTEKLEGKLSATDFQSHGSTAGLFIWRVVCRINEENTNDYSGFSLSPWPRPRLGEFFCGDCYVILNSHLEKLENPLPPNKKGAKAPPHASLHHHIFFWVGMKSSSLSQSVASLKVNELDQHLIDMYGEVSTRYREVQGFECHQFLSMFKDPPMRILHGSSDKKINSERGPSPILKMDSIRLLHVRGKKKVRIFEEFPTWSSLNTGDVYILDTGDVLYKFDGVLSSPSERILGFKAATLLRSERGGSPRIVMISQKDLEDETNAMVDCKKFCSLLNRKGYEPVPPCTDGNASSASEEEDVTENEVGEMSVTLVRLSDRSGTLSFKEEKHGLMHRSYLDSDDVFILDVTYQVFVWIGRNASFQERASAVDKAVSYLHAHNRPVSLPITTVVEGREPRLFINIFSRWKPQVRSVTVSCIVAVKGGYEGIPVGPARQAFEKSFRSDMARAVKLSPAKFVIRSIVSDNAIPTTFASLTKERGHNPTPGKGNRSVSPTRGTNSSEVMHPVQVVFDILGDARVDATLVLQNINVQLPTKDSILMRGRVTQNLRSQVIYPEDVLKEVPITGNTYTGGLLGVGKFSRGCCNSGRCVLM